jgi:hypothetical protein
VPVDSLRVPVDSLRVPVDRRRRPAHVQPRSLITSNHSTSPLCR